MGNAIWPLFLIVGSNIVYQLSSRGAAKNVAKSKFQRRTAFDNSFGKQLGNNCIRH